MEPHIRLLDCTLRDGGHINQGRFGEVIIKNTLERLVEAGIDIIEAGFLWNQKCDIDTARYYTIEDVKKILPKNTGKSSFSLMADFIDLEHLEPCDGTIEYIRLSFKRHRLEWGLKTARVLMNKGYKVFINPVNCNVYTDKQYLEVLEKVNELHPYGFSIVDTFGVMRVSDLSHIYYLVENNLNKDITIGLHLHENLGLAFCLAQHFTKIASPTRKIVIDCSLLGMGRVPGNLCIEQIMDYMNEQYGKGYATEPVYDTIDDYIQPIKRTIEQPWGYAIPYALSAKYNLHRTYAEYLMGKQRLKNKDIQRILKLIERDKAEMFHEEYIEKIYCDYMNVEYDEKEDIHSLQEALSHFNQILILAPGKSIIEKQEKIRNIISQRTCVISVNFDPECMGIFSDFIFLTNTKRYDSIKERKTDNALIITSNLLRDIEHRNYTINYNSLVYFNEEYCDDSTLMLLNLLFRIGVNKVMIAGFDVHKDGKMNFFDENFDRKTNKPSKKEMIRKILDTVFVMMDIEFLTASEYEF